MLGNNFPDRGGGNGFLEGWEVRNLSFFIYGPFCKK